MEVAITLALLWMAADGIRSLFATGPEEGAARRRKAQEKEDLDIELDAILHEERSAKTRAARKRWRPVFDPESTRSPTKVRVDSEPEDDRERAAVTAYAVDDLDPGEGLF